MRVFTVVLTNLKYHLRDVCCCRFVVMDVSRDTCEMTANTIIVLGILFVTRGRLFPVPHCKSVQVGTFQNQLAVEDQVTHITELILLLSLADLKWFSSFGISVTVLICI